MIDSLNEFITKLRYLCLAIYASDSDSFQTEFGQNTSHVNKALKLYDLLQAYVATS